MGEVENKLARTENNDPTLTGFYINSADITLTAITAKQTAFALINNTIVTGVDQRIMTLHDKEAAPYIALIQKITERNKLYSLQRKLKLFNLYPMFVKHITNNINSSSYLKDIAQIINNIIIFLIEIIFFPFVMLMGALFLLTKNHEEVSLPLIEFGSVFDFSPFRSEQNTNLPLGFTLVKLPLPFGVNFASAIFLPLLCVAFQVAFIIPAIINMAIALFYIANSIIDAYTDKERKVIQHEIKREMMRQNELQAEIENDSLTIDFEMTLARINKQVKQTPAKENLIFEDTINKLEKITNTKFKGANILYSLCYHYGCLLIAQGNREHAFNYFLKLQLPHEKYSEAMYECGDYVLCHLKNEKQAIDFYQKAYASAQDESAKEKLQFMINMLSHSEGDIKDVAPAPATRKDILSPVAQSQHYRFFKKEVEANKTKTDPTIIKNNHTTYRNLQLNAG